MSGLSKEHRLTARTAPQVIAGFDVVLVRLQAAGLKFRGRKVGAEGLLGSIVLHFLQLPEAEQANLISKCLPELERLLDDRDAVPSTPAERSAASDEKNAQGRPDRPGPARRKSG